MAIPAKLASRVERGNQRCNGATRNGSGQFQES